MLSGVRGHAMLRRTAVVALALVALARSAGAQPEPAARVADDTAGDAPDDAAKRLCLASFESSQKLRGEQRFVEAREALLLCGQSSCPDVVRAKCIEWIHQVDQALPSIVVAVKDRHGEDAVDAEVRIDDKLVARKLDGSAIAVDPGPHTLRVDIAGERPVKKRIVAQQGEKFRKITVSFAPEPKERDSGAEAQLAALSRFALPDTLPYDEGDEIPPGYEKDTRIRAGLVVGGSVTFGVMWLGSVIAAAGIGEQVVNPAVPEETSHGSRALYVPVVGPFIAIGTLEDKGGAPGIVTLVIDGVTQTGGVAMLLAGIFAREPVLVRAKSAVEPIVGPSQLGVRARF